MRITMGADAKVFVKNGKVKVEATGAEVEDVEASAFTKVGVWFYALWKDAIDVKKKAPAEMKFAVGGEDLVTRVETAAIENDGLWLGLSLGAE